MCGLKISSRRPGADFVTCDYCEGPIPLEDVGAATWGREEEGTRRRARFGFGYERTPPKFVAVVMLCEACREVCTVRELLRMLDQRIAKAKAAGAEEE